MTPLPMMDATLVERLVAAQFPVWRGLPVRAVEPGGWDNRTFRLGPDMAVRLPSGPGHAGQVAKEHRWLPRLAPHLPRPIPRPLALGHPGEGFPHPWSVRDWLPGTPPAAVPVADPVRLARDLGGFLAALKAVDPTGGPPAGEQSAHRGGRLAVYDAEAREALSRLGPRIDGAGAGAVWGAALASAWNGPPVWVHGDVAAGNLLVEDGALAAVIDFGQLAVGDPACDLAVAWTVFDGPARAAFFDAVGLDGATWARARARCWALWKAAITASGRARTSGTPPARGRCSRP